MAAKKTASKETLDAKREEIKLLRLAVKEARDERLIAEEKAQYKVEEAQLDNELDRLKALLSQEVGFLGQVESQTPAETSVRTVSSDNKNKEV